MKKLVTLIEDALDIVYSPESNEIVVGQTQLVPPENPYNGQPWESQMVAKKVVTDRAIGAVVRYMIPGLEPGCDVTLVVSVDGTDYELSVMPCDDPVRSIPPSERVSANEVERKNR